MAENNNIRIYDVIRAKREGKTLSKEEIQFFVDGVCDGSIPDYQTSALLMAICINGMTLQETVDLTFAMANSGDIVDLSPIRGKKVDKHSTGGVGDKTSLVIVPMVAACGAKVAKMSGRGLGHTGGTVDKLESIDGYCTTLEREAFFDVVNQTGASIIGQSGNLAPADKKLYALRDVTATVESLPLIVSSIMSKKIASGADGIVLDVKVGSGSFNKTLDFAQRLATTMIRIGTAVGRNVTAVLSDMDTPLGNAVGNLLEVQEAMEVLANKGPDDLREVCITLATHMLCLAEKGDEKQCRQMAQNSLADGSALDAFRKMVRAHGATASWIDNPSQAPQAPFACQATSPQEGFIAKTDTEKIGVASLLLGAGRKTKEDSIDYLAGLILHKKTGDFVKKGDVIATLYASDQKLFENARNTLLESLTFSADAPQPTPPILKIITREEVKNGEIIL